MSRGHPPALQPPSRALPARSIPTRLPAWRARRRPGREALHTDPSPSSPPQAAGRRPGRQGHALPGRTRRHVDPRRPHPAAATASDSSSSTAPPAAATSARNKPAPRTRPAPHQHLTRRPTPDQKSAGDCAMTMSNEAEASDDRVRAARRVRSRHQARSLEGRGRQPLTTRHSPTGSRRGGRRPTGISRRAAGRTRNSAPMAPTGTGSLRARRPGALRRPAAGDFADCGSQGEAEPVHEVDAG